MSEITSTQPEIQTPDNSIKLDFSLLQDRLPLISNETIQNIESELNSFGTKFANWLLAKWDTNRNEIFTLVNNLAQFVLSSPAPTTLNDNLSTTLSNAWREAISRNEVLKKEFSSISDPELANDVKYISDWHFQRYITIAIKNKANSNIATTKNDLGSLIKQLSLVDINDRQHLIAKLDSFASNFIEWEFTKYIVWEGDATPNPVEIKKTE